MRRVALSSCSTHSLKGFVLSKGSNLSSKTYLQAMQASVVVVPSTISQEFKRFCEVNKESCPLLYQSGIGDTTAGNLAGELDIRSVVHRLTIIIDCTIIYIYTCN